MDWTVSTDADSHSGPHHEDSTSGAESCCHTCPARFCPIATPTHSGNGNHIYHQTRITERPHQPAGGQQAVKPEHGASATGIQERYGGKSSISLSCWLSVSSFVFCSAEAICWLEKKQPFFCRWRWFPLVLLVLEQAVVWGVAML